MQIRFLTSCSTDGPSFACDNVYDVSDELAAGFIAAGLAIAEPATSSPKPAETVETPAPAVVETATVPAVQVETAVQPAPATAAKPQTRAERRAADAAAAKARG